MNLGDSKLGHVNASRPQLVHKDSKQSVTASDDYYSLASDHGSSGDERSNGPRYETPPMRIRSNEQEAPQSEATIQTIRPVQERPIEFGVAEDSASSPKVSRKPLSKTSSQRTIVERAGVADEACPPTPDVDDTPYIQFAIDQLTRDEEIAGRGRQSAPLASHPPIPLARSRDEESGQYQERKLSVSSAGVVAADEVQQKKLPAGSEGATAGDSQKEKASAGAGAAVAAPQVAAIAEAKAASPKFKLFPTPPPVAAPAVPEEQPRAPSPASEKIFSPTDAGEEPFRHPPLRYVPCALGVVSLASSMVCCVLMMAGLAFCAAWALHHPGLYAWDGAGTSRYFVFQYLPQILASVITLWTMAINTTLHRIDPFVALGSGPGPARSADALYDAKLFPTNYMLPNLAHLSPKRPWLAVWALTFWLSLFALPLQSALFQARYYPGEQMWKWTTCTPIAWTLFALYVLLLAGLSGLLCRFARGCTGLKWDPCSLADIFAIFHRSNILHDFQWSEVDPNVKRITKDIRLGYWRDSKVEGEPFYCIGDENDPVRRFSLQNGKIRPVNDEPPLDVEGQRPAQVQYDNFRAGIREAHHRYNWLPWFLRDNYVAAWIAIGFALFIAFIVVSFVNRAVQDGFLPRLSSSATLTGFSPSDFLYSFIPSFIGMIFFLLWQPVDMYFRALQPFASFSEAGGSSAERSILLDYTACLPLEVTLRALIMRHLRVAIISLNALTSVTLPILAGGVFTAQYVPAKHDIRMVASMPGFEALVAFVGFYTLSLLLLFPGRKRYLPHDISTLADLVSFFYQSPLVAEEAFEKPLQKIDLVTRLLGKPVDDKLSTRFAFGIYVGQDGREHLGIDRLERPGYVMLVDFDT